MSTTAADIYNAVTYEQWQYAMRDTFPGGTVCEPFHHDEKFVLKAFRELTPDSEGIRSRMDFFLLGFRTMTLMEGFDEADMDNGLGNGQVPEAVAYKAVEAALDRIGERQKTMMEIATVHHLKVFLRSIDAEHFASLIMPNGMTPTSYMFLSGYVFILNLYKYTL